MRLRDKVAIVTGAAQGIGKAYAQRLAEDGANVVVADIRRREAVATADELNRTCASSALALEVDVASEASTLVMMKQTLEHFGRIDVLVNNAALFGEILVPPRNWDQIMLDEWDQVMAVNVRGVFLCCRAVLPPMISQKSGKIINISSGTVWTGLETNLHYVTSKAAVLGLTRSLAKAVGAHNIQVNAITPGFTQSHSVQSAIPAEVGNMIASVTALGRMQYPEDLVGTVSFLASSDSDFITGQTLNVDGGYVMH